MLHCNVLLQVYCAPTSGGKSLVAEVLMLRCLHQGASAPRARGPRRMARALVVLPYISIVNEKTEHLSHILKPLHCLVKGYSGEAGQGAAREGALFICYTV